MEGRREDHGAARVEEVVNIQVKHSAADVYWKIFEEASN